MSMFYENVNFCPICGYRFTKEDFNDELKLHTCQRCGFQYYHNMIPTSSAIIPKLGEPNIVLLTKRNKEPGKGLYDSPGGFYNYGEKVEDGIKRELMEELGLDIKVKKIFRIITNDYKYQDHTYKHTTIYFTTEPITQLPEIVDKIENSDVIFFDLNALEENHDMFAFEGDFQALKKYKTSLEK